MASTVRRLAVAFLLGGFALLGASSNAADEKKDKKGKDKAVLDLHAIMNNNTPKNSITKKINEAVKGEKWDEAKTLATKFKELGDAITKTTPEKGDKDSWTKLAKKYQDQTTAVYESVEKKDAKATTVATTAFTKSCKACHDLHK